MPDLKAALHRVDDFQQQHRPLAVAVATVKKNSDDEASSHAASLAYFAFFSVFPLLLVFVTVLGYVLAGDHSLMSSVENSVLGQFPVIGDTLKNHGLKGSALALIVGILLSLWSGLGVTGAATRTFDHVWGIERDQRAGYLTTRLRGVTCIMLLGLLFAVASGASGVVTGGLGGPLLLVVGVIVSLLLDVALFLAAFHFLCSQPPAWRQLLPGAVLAAILWEILQALGGVYINHIKHSASAYGTFALVLGILAWLHLGATATVYSAELNTVLARRLWPRPLFAGE